MRVGEEVVELGGEVAGLIAGEMAEPAAAAGQIGRARAALALGRIGICGGAAGRREGAGGDAAQDGAQALAGAGDAGPGGLGEAAERAEGGGDVVQQGKEDRIQPVRKVERRV